MTVAKVAKEQTNLLQHSVRSSFYLFKRCTALLRSVIALMAIQRTHRVFLSMMVVCCGGFTLTPIALASSKVAIIIDDIGYQKVDPRLIELPYALTFAIMPFAPHGKEMAALASLRQKEIMLHMPMEAVSQNHLLGRGALRQPMDQQQVRQALQAAFREVPQAVGINNHMGSLYTSLAEPMDWTLEWVAEQGLYVVDSKTTARSAIPAAAARHQVPMRSRDIFLDNDKSYAALERQFQQLLSIAQREGSAIAIGHPYPETYAYLKKHLPSLASKGIEIVPASALIASADVNSLNQRLVNNSSHGVDSVEQETPQPSGSSTKPSPLPTQSSSAPTQADYATALPAATAEQKVQQLEPLIEVPALQLRPWHPPYRADLPGFVMPEHNKK